jgi:hypothetical protein
LHDIPCQGRAPGFLLAIRASNGLLGEFKNSSVMSDGWSFPSIIIDANIEGGLGRFPDCQRRVGSTSDAHEGHDHLGMLDPGSVFTQHIINGLDGRDQRSLLACRPRSLAA